MLINQLRERITEEDDIRIYPLQNRGDGLHMGCSRLPDGLTLGMTSEWSAILECDGSAVTQNSPIDDDDRDNSGNSGNPS